MAGTLLSLDSYGVEKATSGTSFSFKITVVKITLHHISPTLVTDSERQVV